MYRWGLNPVLIVESIAEHALIDYPRHPDRAIPSCWSTPNAWDQSGVVNAAA